MKLGCTYLVVYEDRKLFVDGELKRKPDKKLLNFVIEKQIRRANVRRTATGFQIARGPER